MVSAENKPKKKGKDEKKNLCSAWEGFEADNRTNDDNVLYGCWKAKQQIKHKCRYLDEKNVVVADHLRRCPWSSGSERSDVAEKIPPGLDASQDNTLSTTSPVVLPADPSPLRQSPSDTDCFPANNNALVNPMIHKQSIIYGLSPMGTSSLEVKKHSLPLIRWAPAASRVLMLEEPVAWRCKGLATVNREARPAEPSQLWKRASGKKLEWGHGRPARLAHLQVQSPKNGPSVARKRPVIQREARLTAGHGGVQVQDSHVEQNFSQKAAETKHRDLPHDSDGSASGVPTNKQALYNSLDLWSPTQAEAGLSSAQLVQQGGIATACSDVSQWMDVLCQSGYQGNSKSSTGFRDVTLFHVLQILQSKPVHFPQVGGQRRLEVL
ncbi:hypothetical protein AMEX_G8835 [Astyanax mexicanus]|uniref:Uncharacterized protein n=1 Tax=Astyanax mexicanus TaxID=7994 RepID=A0A8T2M0H5_ASTMX|nr:hypothetical protein AMEX_G8835 [Astyanax mexicanus]